MLKKEINETIKQILVFFTLVIVTPLLILLMTHSFNESVSYDQLFFPIFQIGFLIFSLFMGISLFSKEMKDNGMEYLFTLPYSRMQLLRYKLLPRIGAVAGLMGIYILLLTITGINPETSSSILVLPTGMMAFIGISIFFLGLPFSFNKSGIVISALGAFFGFMIFLYLAAFIFPVALLLKGFDVHNYSMFNAIPRAYNTFYNYFIAVIFLLGSTVAFIYAFKRFDLGPVRVFIKRYLKVFIPIITIFSIITLIWAISNIWTPKQNYFLTENHKLIEFNYFSSQIYDKNSVLKTDLGDFIWRDDILEKDNYFYTVSAGKSNYNILRLALNNSEKRPEILYKTNQDAWLRGIYEFQNTFAFFEIKREQKQKNFTLILLKLGTGVENRIEIPHQGRISIMYPNIFGADEINGKRFWLIRFGYDKMNRIYRVWESGTIEDLGRTDWPPVYTKGLLLTGRNHSLIISRFTESSVEIINKQPVENNFTFFYALPKCLDQHPLKELYGCSGGIEPYGRINVFRFDLETFELNEIEEFRNTSAIFGYAHPNNWYYIELKPDSNWRSMKLMKIYNLVDGKPILKKDFAALEITQKNDFFNLNNAGIVIKSDDNTLVYTVPDFKELEYKKLE